MTTPHPVLMLISIATAFNFVVFIASWVYARKMNNYSIVDVIWAFSFGATSLTLASVAPVTTRSEWILIAMLIAWSMRLGSHLGRRVFSHLESEDSRYLELRREYGAQVESRFLRFYLFQATSVVILLAPIYVALVGGNASEAPWCGTSSLSGGNDPSQTICQDFFTNPVRSAAVLLWIIGWIGESIADAQLAVFKRKPENRGKVCEVGLWSWSRHPNYFFECVIWFGMGIYALSYPHGWIGILSPIIITTLIVKMTGVPYAEAQSLKSKPELYRDYQARVSTLIPWPPKTRRN